MIIFYKEVFEREGLSLWLKPYSIVSTSKTTGLIEVSKRVKGVPSNLNRYKVHGQSFER